MESKKKNNKPSIKTDKKKRPNKLTKEDKIELEKIGLAIMQKRIFTGFSSETFANKNDFSRTWFGEIERGNIDFRITSFLRLMRAFGITPLEFFAHLTEWAEMGAGTRKLMGEKKQKK